MGTDDVDPVHLAAEGGDAVDGRVDVQLDVVLAEARVAMEVEGAGAERDIVLA